MGADASRARPCRAAPRADRAFSSFADRAGISSGGLFRMDPKPNELDPEDSDPGDLDPDGLPTFAPPWLVASFVDFFGASFPGMTSLLGPFFSDEPLMLLAFLNSPGLTSYLR